MYYFISFYSKIFLKVVEHIKDSVQVLYKYTEFPENCQEKKKLHGYYYCYTLIISENIENIMLLWISGALPSKCQVFKKSKRIKCSYRSCNFSRNRVTNKMLELRKKKIHLFLNYSLVYQAIRKLWKDVWPGGKIKG